MAQRKLQQEVDKCFKKVAEGRQAFDTTHEKLQQANNPAQKEKLEDQLKREIKKLQRLRDQIKTWCAGNEIKDKKPLLEQRKLIESEMERFKAVEKEMKTKAFSKEGLSAAAKLDPKEQEKADGAQFLSEMVEELDRQIETLEAEKESLEVTVKKGKKDTGRADRLSEIARLCEQHQWHQTKLEQLNRALQNGNVDVEQLNDVKDGIKYYVEENQSPEFMEDDTLYDEFDLDNDDANYGANELDKVSSHDTPSQDDAQEGGGPGPSISKAKEPNEAPSTSRRRPSNQLKSPLPALATLHSSSTPSNNSIVAGNMKPAPPPTRAPGETLKYASAAAAAAASEKGGIAPLPPPPGPAQSLAPLPSAPSKGSSAPSPAAAPSVPVRTQVTTHQKTSTAASDAGASTAAAPSAASTGRSPTVSNAASSSMPPTPALEKSETATSAKGKATQSLATAEEAHEDSPNSEHPHTPPPISNAAGALQTNGNAAIENQEESVYHLPPGLQDLLQSFEITKQRVNALASPSPASLRLLEISHSTCPDPLEGDKPFLYRPQNRYLTPPQYPQDPFAIVNDPTLYNRIDTDTLFFVFYYRQNTYQQYLAAKSLKSQSWRFHKQYQTWFQRHEEPKTITEEYEQGTYRFFDYESTWMNRRKADFKFAYKFLEDDL